jgi:hypothetical protein
MEFLQDEDELNSDPKYLACVNYLPERGLYVYNTPLSPLSVYKGPLSLKNNTRKIIKTRYENSLAKDAFPPNILVNVKDSRRRTLLHRRLQRSSDMQPWVTPVPRLGHGGRPVPLNDGGQVRFYACILSCMYVMCEWDAQQFDSLCLTIIFRVVVRLAFLDFLT